MSRTRKVVPWLAAAVSLIDPAVAFQPGALGFGGLADDQNFGPPGYDANSQAWLDAVAASNSTGLFKIPGYDVSQPWPGKPLDGWEFSVAAVAIEDVGFTDASGFVGYSMTLQAPDSLIRKDAHTDSTVVDVDPSWGLCFWNWESPSYDNRTQWNNPDDKPLATDGSCSGWLSDACIEALEQAAATSYFIAANASYTNHGWYKTSLDCQQLSTPAVCGSLVGGSPSVFVDTSGIPIQYLNGTVLATDSFDIDANTTTQDKHDMWDSMVLNFWPVMTAWVPMAQNITESESGTPKAALTQLRCIGPDGVGTGREFSWSGKTSNETPGQNASSGGNSSASSHDGGKSGAASIAGSLGWAVFTAVMAAAFVSTGILNLAA